MTTGLFDESARQAASRPEASESPGKRGAKVLYNGVTKRYGAFRALSPTSLEIDSGEFFSIIGPSGSGKTTLLGVTAGFIPPSEGEILVNGRDLVGIPPFQRNIGMVFQNYSLFPHMTVRENVGFPLRMRKVPRAEAQERTARMLGIVRLAGMEDRYPNQLSGGQQQRVALARAAVYDPVLLLMDEPLSALDKNLREEMQHEIKRFQHTLGTTVIYVTHDQHEASSMSHRIAIMNAGRLEQVGSPRELYDDPRNRFVASFLGEANLFEVASHAPARNGYVAVQTTQGFRITARGPMPDSDRFVLCVRPEKISIDHARREIANCLSGTVTDVVYSAGTVHYQIEVQPDTVVNQKIQGSSAAKQFDVGETVYLSWDPDDSQLISER